MKKIVSLIASASFLFAVTAAAPALAADDWATWPPKKAVPPAEGTRNGTISEKPVTAETPAAETAAVPATAETAAAARAGGAAGKNTQAGLSKGTIGWAAAIIGGAALIGIAAAGGGGGGGTTTTSNH